MKRLFFLFCAVAALLMLRSVSNPGDKLYASLYTEDVGALESSAARLHDVISSYPVCDSVASAAIMQAVNEARLVMKRADFWLRYLEPAGYRLINAPLPVEWETEVFEKFEKPYRREGGGLSLVSLQLGEPTPDRQRLLALADSVRAGCRIFASDSVRRRMESFHHFYLCNRLFLLNLAAIYTTGFECPSADRVLPELNEMLLAVWGIYKSFNEAYPQTSLTSEYLDKYKELVAFVKSQPGESTHFDHYLFIRDYINPLFAANQEFIRRFSVSSRSMIDYALNRKAGSIFDKRLYTGQNAKGIFRRVDDSAALTEIEETGRLLFYDPILSGNNQRSCASCHKPDQYFTDTSVATALHFDGKRRLSRNTPSLVNAGYNHLLMADGRHFTLEGQARDVMSNPAEMGCDEEALIGKIVSCKVYRKHFDNLLKYTPQEKQVTVNHIASCLALYYSTFSRGYSAFDDAMNGGPELNASAKRGFNFFMGKAQCATCHFVPQFNGVKPPYIGSEFEVLGVPGDKAYTNLSADSGRYNVNPASETLRAFRTGTVRNAARTAPYMHNGVFGSLREVIDFYDAGGGAGRGLDPGNQTLSADSLHLTELEKQDLIAFIEALTEKIPEVNVPASLPVSKVKALNGRRPLGKY